MHTAIELAGITTLDRLSSNDESRSGAKAFNCARLKQAGFRVPDGLVIRADAGDADIAAVAAHPWLDGFPPGTRFAVRSSGIGEDGAGESFAGIHQTLLDVQREDLPGAIASCRASGRGEAALEYRRAKGLPLDEIAMGVLVQQMVRAVVAGVGFTTNPLNGARNELVINASWGLGEALVSGQVDPDEFVVRKSDGELLWSRLGDKGRPDATPQASLTRAQLSELARVLVAIEQHYGSPQDVEWCHDGTELWIVQSRPITTSTPDINETEWTRANLAEVLPDLTCPQALVAFEDMLNRAEAQYLGGLMGDAAKLGPIVKSFHGRLHFNLDHLRHTCTLSAVPAAVMLRSMGYTGTIRPEDERLPKPSLATLARAGDFARIVWQHLRAAAVIERHDVRSRDYLRRFAERDPQAMLDAHIWDTLRQWIDDSPDFMQPVMMLGNVGFHEAPLQKICDSVGASFQALLYPQLAAGARSVSAQQAFDLVALAAVARREPAAAAYVRSGATDLGSLRAALRGTTFLERFERFLRLYGHRGLYEYDWSLPRYSEDPSPLLHAIRAHLDAPAEPELDDAVIRARAAADAWSAFEARLTPWQRVTKLRAARRRVRAIKQYYIWREQVRSDLVRVLAAARQWHLVLAARFVERGWIARRDDYFLLHLDEIEGVIERGVAPAGLRAIVDERIATRERQRTIQMPLLMRESELPLLIRTSALLGESGGDELTGLPVSRGCVEAEVVVVRDPGDFARMKRGAILVAPATDPSWTPLFTLASGIIVEVGGVLSHASTIAREYGLPAVANVRQATKRLRTGERVRLDAINGVVQRLAS
jgi:rifampicin phosphotransferase